MQTVRLSIHKDPVPQERRISCTELPYGHFADDHLQGVLYIRIVDPVTYSWCRTRAIDEKQEVMVLIFEI